MNKSLHTRPVLRTALERFRLLWEQNRWDSIKLSDPRSFLYEMKGIGETLTRNFHSKIDFQKERCLSRQFVKEQRPRKILVLCYGNICRSPYAERLLRECLPFGSIEIRSAGFYPEPGRHSPESFVEMVSPRGIDLKNHRSVLADTDLLEWADILLIMDRINWKQVRSQRKKYLSKTVWLGSFGPEEFPVEIDDPYCKPPERMQAILDHLDGACLGFARDWRRTSGDSAQAVTQLGPQWHRSRKTIPSSKGQDSLFT